MCSLLGSLFLFTSLQNYLEFAQIHIKNPNMRAEEMAMRAPSHTSPKSAGWREQPSNGECQLKPAGDWCRAHKADMA